MCIRMSKTILLPGVFVCAVVLGLVSLDSVSARNNKVNICHYQEGNDSWKLISVGQPAAGAHLQNHDDALPGGTTSKTGTMLDADCEEVTVICPCWNTDEVVAAFATWESIPNDAPIGPTCLPFVIRASESTRVGNGLPLLRAEAGVIEGENACEFELIGDPEQVLLRVFRNVITDEEVRVCQDELATAAPQICSTP